MSYEPDYDSYSYEELVDVFRNIDLERYPDRFNKVVKLLGKDIRALLLSEDIDDRTDEEISVDSDLAGVLKAKRINDFFDSLSYSGSEFHAGESGPSASSDGGSVD